MNKAVRHKSFTMVEMLTVIAIITILFSLMLPTVTIVRQRAVQAACASNLRNIGIAMLAYSSNYRGALPQSGNGVWATNFGESLEDLIAPYIILRENKLDNGSRYRIGGPFICKASPLSYNSTTRSYNKGPMQGAVKNSYALPWWGAAICSGKDGKPPAMFQRAWSTAQTKWPNRKPMQLCAVDRGGSELGYHVVDSSGVFGDVRNSDGYSWSIGSSWHGEHGPRPTLFVDGHVKIMQEMRHRYHGWYTVERGEKLLDGVQVKIDEW